MGLLDDSDSDEEAGPGILGKGYLGTLTVPEDWGNRVTGKQKKIMYGPYVTIAKGETVEFTLKGPCAPDKDGVVTHWHARALGATKSLTSNRRDLPKKLMRDMVLSGAEDIEVPIRLIKPAPRVVPATATEPAGVITSHVERTTLAAHRAKAAGMFLATQSYFIYEDDDKKAAEAGEILSMGGATSGGGSRGTGAMVSKHKDNKEDGDESQGISLDRKKADKRKRLSAASEFQDSEDEVEEERKSHLCATKDFNSLEIKKGDPLPPRMFKIQ